MKITDDVRERINALAEMHGGHITPDIVLADARDASSPLHSLYNWDTSQAAHEHWLDTSRRIIRSVRVVIREERSVIRAIAFVRDPSVQSNKQGYVSVAKLRTDEDLSREALIYEFTRAAAALRRARELAAALSLREDMEVMLEQIDMWRLQAERGEQHESRSHGGN